jgi:hypothetical protein
MYEGRETCPFPFFFNILYIVQKKNVSLLEMLC